MTKKETHNRDWKVKSFACDCQNIELETLASVRKMVEDTPKVECVLQLTHEDDDAVDLGWTSCVVVAF